VYVLKTGKYNLVTNVLEYNNMVRVKIDKISVESCSYKPDCCNWNTYRLQW